MCHEVLKDVMLFGTVIKNILIDENRCVITEVVKSTSLSLCPCYVCVIVINQNCQKQGKLCKLFLHMPSTEFAHAQ